MINRSAGTTIVRAEARGPDFSAALAAALTKLKTQLRRSHDRRQVRRDEEAVGSNPATPTLRSNRPYSCEVQQRVSARVAAADADAASPVTTSPKLATRLHVV